MNILQIIAVTIFAIVAMLEISADVYAIVWKVYDRKKPCYGCQYHRAVSRWAPCELCGVKHECWVEDVTKT